MLKAIDVANFFVELANIDNDEITNLRVNKLIYFAQAYSIVCTGKPLFDEPIEAWEFGPVVRDVYNTFKLCGPNQIVDTAGEFSFDKFNEQQIDLITDVIVQYGQFTTSKLVDLTHKQDGPWFKAYHEDNCYNNHVISQDAIGQYFQNKLRKCNDSSLETKSEFVGYRDSEGCLVLPNEMYEEE